MGAQAAFHLVVTAPSLCKIILTARHVCSVGRVSVRIFDVRDQVGEPGEQILARWTL
jgi:hypothetical protein